LAFSFWPLAFGSYQQSKKISPNKLLPIFHSSFLPAAGRLHFSFFTTWLFFLGSFYLAVSFWLLAFSSIRLDTGIFVSFTLLQNNENYNHNYGNQKKPHSQCHVVFIQISP